MKPSVGRIVHYVAYGTPGGEYKAGAHRAAIVTQVHSDSCIDICIINPTGLFFATSALLMDPSVDVTPGTWHWPERE
jgi:hypothetical protein